MGTARLNGGLHTRASARASFCAAGSCAGGEGSSARSDRLPSLTVETTRAPPMVMSTDINISMLRQFRMLSLSVSDRGSESFLQRGRTHDATRTTSPATISRNGEGSHWVQWCPAPVGNPIVQLGGECPSRDRHCLDPAFVAGRLLVGGMEIQRALKNLTNVLKNIFWKKILFWKKNLFPKNTWPHSRLIKVPLLVSEFSGQMHFIKKK